MESNTYNIYNPDQHIVIDHNGEGTCIKMLICPIFIGLIFLLCFIFL